MAEDKNEDLAEGTLLYCLLNRGRIKLVIFSIPGLFTPMHKVITNLDKFEYLWKLSEVDQCCKKRKKGEFSKYNQSATAKFCSIIIPSLQ